MAGGGIIVAGKEVMMAVKEKPRRPSAGARRAGYLIGALVNGLMLIAVNGWPGWQAVPFLTGETQRVAGVVDLTLAVSLVVSLAYVAYDPEWFTAPGGLVTAGTGLVSAIRVWQVFPSDFGDPAFDWALTARILLVVGIVGTAIAVQVQLVALVRARIRGRG